MSYCVDSNVLLYATDLTSPHYPPAAESLKRLAQKTEIVYLFWPVLMSYLRVSTHPSIFASPLSPVEAADNIKALLALPHVRSPGEEPGFWESYSSVVAGQSVRGNLVPDAHIVALMRQHGVAVIWSEDRDFRRFDGVTVLTLAETGL
ncbi:MAG: TA system VapC family ribonuclease toxin [Actinomycetota bacterium]